ncbi:MAG: twin-arginine translocase TatA/TatE family subunit [Myxococcota bacterium]
MFSGLGWGEMALIAVVTLLVIPPDRLPHVMRQLGRWYGQLRRAADELRRAFVLEADRQDAAERYRQLQERRRKAQEARKQAEAATGGGAQPVEIDEWPPKTPATVVDDDHEAPEAGDHEDEEEAEEVPNDIPPDAPHPRLKRGEG